jgi:hypothetical protein
MRENHPRRLVDPLLQICLGQNLSHREKGTGQQLQGDDDSERMIL